MTEDTTPSHRREVFIRSGNGVVIEPDKKSKKAPAKKKAAPLKKAAVSKPAPPTALPPVVTPPAEPES